MSGYMAMLCRLPAFLAAITSAFGLRAGSLCAQLQGSLGLE